MVSLFSVNLLRSHSFLSWHHVQAPLFWFLKSIPSTEATVVQLRLKAARHPGQSSQKPPAPVMILLLSSGRSSPLLLHCPWLSPSLCVAILKYGLCFMGSICPFPAQCPESHSSRHWHGLSLTPFTSLCECHCPVASTRVKHTQHLLTRHTCCLPARLTLSVYRAT